MNMSPLMTVQPILDTSKNVAAGTNGKTQGSDSFQTLLKDQMTANQAEKSAPSQQKSQQTSSSSEPKLENKESSKQESAKQTSSASEENKGVTNAAQSEEQVTVDLATDTAVLAQVMAAAAAGVQMVPVESTTPTEAVALTEEIGATLPLSVTADSDGLVSDKTLKDARDIKTLAAKADTKESVLVDGKLSTETKTEVKTDINAEVKGELKVDAKEIAKTNVVTQAAENTTLATDQKAVSTTTIVTGADKTVTEALQNQLTGTQPVQQTTPVMAAQPQVAPTHVVEANQSANQIVQRMGTPEWNQAVGQRVMWMIGQEQQSASLTLNPPELGPVRIVVNVSNNQATANFFSANPDVRQALEGSLPRLREMMEGAGIQLGQAQVGAENSGNSQQEQLASSGSRTQGTLGDGSEGGSIVTGVAGETQTTKQVVSKGLVDTFV